MPSYDILCDNCGHLEERQLRISETDNLSPCSECESEQVRIAILSAPDTIYKGRGWFKKSGSYDNRDPAKGSKISRTDIRNYDNDNKVTM